MHTFIDKQGAQVTLSFEKDAFSKEANHVFIICAYKGQWLLTKHKKRGWEFPGGKREHGETLEETARREVYEETGATIETLQLIGAYEVVDEQSVFIKAIFLAEIANVQKQNTYYETDGPVLVSKEELTAHRFDDSYSFVMQDDVVGKTLQMIGEILS